uniref:Secreted protein n=1 Tax=Zonotrichia albicollis TaxID=44394 RepID=A0A8D2N9V8_ZONAL
MFRSQLFSFCLFQLGNASHRFWTQDIPAPVTTDLQGKNNRLETASISHCGTQFCTRGKAPSTKKSCTFQALHYILGQQRKA